MRAIKLNACLLQLLFDLRTEHKSRKNKINKNCKYKNIYSN